MSAGAWGDRLRERARALGLTDSEVARRVGLTQRRYSSYVNMSREPNFADLLRICAGLGTTPDYVLGVREPDGSSDDLRRAGTALERMSAGQRVLALAALDGMADAAGRQEVKPKTTKPRPPPRAS